MQEDTVSIKSTGDGSHTLFNAKLNEHYHSVHGAKTESIHVFIKNGLELVHSENKPLRILEIGFGTGLNAFLTARFAHENQRHIEYISLETFPLGPEITSGLAESYTANADELRLFNQIHECPWDEISKIHPYFELYKKEKRIQDFNTEEKFNLIYFDAFAPDKQPEMWEPEIFAACFDWLETEGILVTYCAKGQFKRNLKAAGFAVEARPGPPGKREMTIGRKLLSV